MQEARILHCEDDESIREKVEHVLSARGIHRVVATAESYNQALEQVNAIKRRKLNANVVLLAGHLRRGIFVNHPKVIAREIKDKNIKVHIVGLSLNGLAVRGLNIGDNIGDVAVDITKLNFADDEELLGQALNDLPELDR
jgi:CheY-like chemotaxis protein